MKRHLNIILLLDTFQPVVSGPELFTPVLTNQHNVRLCRTQDATDLLHEDLVLVRQQNTLLYYPYSIYFSK